MVALLAGREPLVYRRHAHWFDGLSGAEERILPG